MKQGFLHFNRGRVDRLALARVDQKRVAVSADVMTNFIPRVLGPMSLRPGTKYLHSTLNNNDAVYEKFIFDIDDTALLEFTASAMRIVVDDELVTRSTVTAAVTNGTFTTDLTGWTDSDEGAATSAWYTGGYMRLTGDGSSHAIRDQEVTVNEAGTEHALRIVINRGPVIFSVGSAQGTDSYVTQTTLETGTHSLSFTPTGNFWIRFKSNLERMVLVDSCTVEGAGVMQLPTPWTANDLANIRTAQSGDILFCACKGFQQRQIKRRSTTSWSVVKYEPEDGPFLNENLTPTTLTPSALVGNITLTASAPLFKSTDAGGLMQITSDGQEVTATIAAENTFTDPIRVTGIDADRIFTIVLDGTWSATTITLQRSLVDETGPWSDVATKTWTDDTTETYDDGLDNQIAWYQIGCKTGDFGVGDSVACSLDYAAGSITGNVRLLSYSSTTSMTAEVLKDLGGTNASKYWSFGKWSERRGWPTAVGFHDGRLWWVGQDSIVGSISDNYYSFDPLFEGDAGPIVRTLGSGPVDNINWVVSLQRLILGGQMAEFSIRASSFDEPLTPTSFTIRRASTQGSASVEAEVVDQTALYVNRAGYRVYELTLSGQSYDYASVDKTVLVPEMGAPGITRMAVQRQPDTRIHCVRSDGTVMLGVIDSAEEVLAWVDVETDGLIRDVVVLPGTEGDDVYYVVRRTINSSTVTYLEKVALESNCRGGTVNYLADSYVYYSGAAATTITGLSHLEGESVVVWADGADVGTDSSYDQTYTVVGGQITLSESASDVIVGLPYTGQFKSARTGAGEASMGVAFDHRRIDWLTLVMAWVHPKGLRFGPDFDHLDDLPLVEDWATIDDDAIRTDYDYEAFEFPGVWGTNQRICLQAQAPRPVTVLAAIPEYSK